MKLPIVVSYHHNVDNLDSFLQDKSITITVHSEMMKKDLDKFPNVFVIHYGIRVDHIPFFSKTMNFNSTSISVLKKLKQTGGEYLLTLGRIGKIKGTYSSLEIAKLSGFSMVVAGEVVAVTDTKKSI